MSETAVGISAAAHREEMLVQQVIMAISTTSVPHRAATPGASESRSLNYYLKVGIDYLGHDIERHEALLRKAAEQVIVAIRRH